MFFSKNKKEIELWLKLNLNIDNINELLNSRDITDDEVSILFLLEDYKPILALYFINHFDNSVSLTADENPIIMFRKLNQIHAKYMLNEYPKTASDLYILITKASNLKAKHFEKYNLNDETFLVQYLANIYRILN